MSRLIAALFLLLPPGLAQTVTVQWPEFALPKVEVGSPPFTAIHEVFGNGANSPFTVTATGAFIRLKTSSGVAPASGSARLEYDLVFDGYPSGTQLQGSVTVRPQGQNPIVIPVTAGMVTMGWDFIPANQLLQLTAAADGTVNGSFALRFIRDARVFIVSQANGIPFDRVLIENEAHPAGYLRTVPVTARMAGYAPGRYTSDYLVIPSDINHYPLRFMKIEVTIPAISLPPGQGHLITQGAPPVTVPIAVTNIGPSVPFTLSSGQPWLRAAPSTGTLPADGAASATLTIDVTGLLPGQYTAALRASAPGRNDATSTFTLNVAPVAISSPVSQINLTGFTTGSPTGWQTAAITTNSPYYLRYTVSTSDPWISSSPASQYVHSASPSSVTVNFVGGVLPPGVHRGSITISAPPAQPLTIPVVATLTEPVLSPTPASLSLRAAPPAEVTANLFVSFTMPASLQIAASSQNGWLSVSPSVHSTSPATLTVRANSALAPIGTNRGVITLSANGLTREVPVTLEVTPPVNALSAWPPRLELLDTQIAAPQSLEIRSLLGVPVEFTVQSTVDWLSVPSGPHSAPVRLPVSLLAGRLPAQASETTLRLIPRDPLLSALDIPVAFNRAATGWFVIPQIADGGGFRTRIDLFNDSAMPASVRIDLFRLASRAARSTEPWFPAFQGAPSWQQFTLPAFGSVALETLGLPAEADSGWARLQAPPSLRGFAVYRQRQSSGIDQEASVPLLAERSSRFLLPFDQTAGQTAAVALANICNPAANLLAAAFDEAGAPIATAELGAWPALGHDTFVLPSILPATAGRRGLVEFVASRGCVAPIGLRFTPAGAFTSVDPQPPSAALALVFPQVADGGGFSTSLVLTNHDTQPAAVSLRFRASAGEAATTTAWDPGIPSSVLIPAGASLTLESSGRPATPISGWASATSSQRISGFAVFRRSVSPSDLQEATVAGKPAPTARAVFPFDNTNGLVTSMAILNAASSQGAPVSVLVRDARGAILSTASLQLAPLAHSAFELPLRFPETAGIQGSIEFLAPSASLYLLPLRFAPGGAFTSIRSSDR